jgi:3-phosphoshikimate 1-carboxyvinyltransferase
MAGLLAGIEGKWELTGDPQLLRRPMERIAKPLRLMGVDVTTTDGHPPIFIKGGGLRGVEYEIPVPSAQVKSAAILAGINADGNTIVRELIPTRDHTERMLLAMGAGLDVEDTDSGRVIRISGPVTLKPVELFIPGDISSAAYIIGLAALIPGSSVTITDVLLNPTRTAYISHLRAMGVRVETDLQCPDNFEPYGDVNIRGSSELHNVPIPESNVPGLIDEIPLLSMVGAFATGQFELIGARELRVKETDRIAAIVHNLRSMGIEVEEWEDGFSFTGGTQPNACEFNSFGDHRMALACCVAGMAIGRCSLFGAEAAAISYPEFYEHVSNIR